MTEGLSCGSNAIEIAFCNTSVLQAFIALLLALATALVGYVIWYLKKLEGNGTLSPTPTPAPTPSPTPTPSPIPPPPPIAPPPPVPFPPSPPNPPPSQNPNAAERSQLLGEFIAATQGLFLNIDQNPYGAQCVELVNAWCDKLGIERFPGNAMDFEFDSHPDCEWVVNTPTNMPLEGDLIVWGKSSALPFGHVAVNYSAGPTGFISYDQNWPLNSPCHLQAHNYGDVRGWFVPHRFGSE